MLPWISRQWHSTRWKHQAPAMHTLQFSTHVLKEHQEKHGPSSFNIPQVHYHELQLGHLDLFQLEPAPEPDGLTQPRARASSWNVLRWWLELAYWTRDKKITKKHWHKKTENPTEKRKECFPYQMGTSIFAGSDSIRRSSCRFHIRDFLGICRCQWSPSHGRESAHVPILRIGHGLERVEGDLLLLLHQHQHPKCSLACQAGRRGWVHLVGLLMAVFQMAQFPVAVQVLGLVLLVELHLPKSACWNIFWDLDFLYWDNCEESSPVLVWVHLIAFRPTSLATFGRCCVSHIPSPMRPAL